MLCNVFVRFEILMREFETKCRFRPNVALYVRRFNFGNLIRRNIYEKYCFIR